jgi:hypothetical protein
MVHTSLSIILQYPLSLTPEGMYILLGILGYISLPLILCLEHYPKEQSTR